MKYEKWINVGCLVVIVICAIGSVPVEIHALLAIFCTIIGIIIGREIFGEAK